jgi:hypothetical protein
VKVEQREEESGAGPAKEPAHEGVA